MYLARRRQKNVDNEAELFTPEFDFDSMPARSQEKRQGLLNASGFALFYCRWSRSTGSNSFYSCQESIEVRPLFQRDLFDCLLRLAFINVSFVAASVSFIV